MSWLTDLFVPTSDEGDVYRAEWFDLGEPVFYGVVLFAGTAVGIGFLVQRDAVGAAVLLVAPLLCVVARRAWFRRHVVLGPAVIILTGILNTRRIELHRIRRAEASKDGTVQLLLHDGEVVLVPGFTVYRYWGVLGQMGNPKEGSWFAGEVNRRIALVSRT